MALREIDMDALMFAEILWSFFELILHSSSESFLVRLRYGVTLLHPRKLPATFNQWNVQQYLLG